MLKLMRACIKVKKEEDLWVMQNKPVARKFERKAHHEFEDGDSSHEDEGENADPEENAAEKAEGD